MFVKCNGFLDVMGMMHYVAKRALCMVNQCPIITVKNYSSEYARAEKIAWERGWIRHRVWLGLDPSEVFSYYRVVVAKEFHQLKEVS